MKRQIPVRWTFAQKPAPPPMMTLRNGQQIIRGVVHELRPEGYPRTTRIWCYGCREYFKSWHEVLWRHGLCKERPGAKVKRFVPEKPKKNDKVPLPRGFQLWSVSMMKSWIRQHRPENYDELFGKGGK